MKLEKKEFEKKVKEIRNMMPAYNNGRKVVVVSEYSKLGERVLSMGVRYEGYYLWQVYDRPSEAKQEAYNDAFAMYCNSRHGESFGICSHNCQSFTVSWIHDGGMTVLTSRTEYLVIFNE